MVSPAEIPKHFHSLLLHFFHYNISSAQQQHQHIRSQLDLIVMKWSSGRDAGAGGVWGGSGWHIKYVSPTKGYGMRQLPVHFLLSALIWVIVLWLSFSDSCDKDLNELSQSLREPS